MAKNKSSRDMTSVGEAQQKTEAVNEDKFAGTRQLAEAKNAQLLPQGRISPQLSCTILPEDKEKLNELTLFLSNKKGRVLNTSTIVRALIRLGERYKNELDIEQ